MTLALLILVVFTGSSSAQLSTNFYYKSCPKLLNTVRAGIHAAVAKEARMGASLLRLHFHDCFVNVCTIYIYYFFKKSILCLYIFFIVFSCHSVSYICILFLSFVSFYMEIIILLSFRVVTDRFFWKILLRLQESKQQLPTTDPLEGLT